MSRMRWDMDVVMMARRLITYEGCLKRREEGNMAFVWCGTREALSRLRRSSYGHFRRKWRKYGRGAQCLDTISSCLYSESVVKV